MASDIFVDKKAADEYLCMICLDVMQRPAQLGCSGGHIFCRECIAPLLQSSLYANCPVCRTTFHFTSIVEIPYIQRKIDHLFVLCPHHHSFAITPRTTTNITQDSCEQVLNETITTNNAIDNESESEIVNNHNNQAQHQANVPSQQTEPLTIQPFQNVDFEQIKANGAPYKCPFCDILSFEIWIDWKQHWYHMHNSTYFDDDSKIKNTPLCGRKRKRMEENQDEAPPKKARLNDVYSFEFLRQDPYLAQAIALSMEQNNEDNHNEGNMHMDEDENENDEQDEDIDLNDGDHDIQQKEAEIVSESGETKESETPHTTYTEGCDWSGRYKDLSKHLDECMFEETKCIYAVMGCKQRILRKDLDIHKKECEYYPVQCPQCITKISRGYLTKHISDDCVMAVIKCDNCSIELERKALHKHLKYECGEMLIKCEYSKYGCNLMKRNEKEMHYEQCMEHHLKLVSASHHNLEETVLDLALRLEEIETNMNSHPFGY